MLEHNLLNDSLIKFGALAVRLLFVLGSAFTKKQWYLPYLHPCILVNLFSNICVRLDVLPFCLGSSLHFLVCLCGGAVLIFLELSNQFHTKSLGCCLDNLLIKVSKLVVVRGSSGTQFDRSSEHEGTFVRRGQIVQRRKKRYQELWRDRITGSFMQQMIVAITIMLIIPLSTTKTPRDPISVTVTGFSIGLYICFSVHWVVCVAK